MDIEHKVLINEFPDQMNTLQVHLPSGTRDFIFDKQAVRLKIL